MAEKKTLFVREVSGVVRAFSALDVMILNLTNVAIGASVWFNISGGLFTRPDGDLVLAFILGGLIGLGVLVPVFSFLSTLMPRSGGPYVATSRAVHPLLGFLVTWCNVFVQIFWIAVWAGMLGTWALPILFATMGAALNNSAIFNLMYIVSDPLNATIIAIVATVVLGLIPALGMKRYAKVQLIEFLIGMLSLVLCWVLLGSASYSYFVERFNRFSIFFGAPENYANYVLGAASNAGWTIPPKTALGTFLLLLAPILGNIYWTIFASSYIAGEIKEVRKSQFVGTAVAQIVHIASYIITYLLMIKVAGNLVPALNYLFSIGSKEYYFGWAVPPYYSTFACILTDNIILLLLIDIGLIAWCLMYIPAGIITISRVVLAWSFDRLLPEQLSVIHPKYNVPIRAIVLAIICTLPFAYLYVSWPLFFVYILPYTLDCLFFVGVGLAALLIPYKMRELFEASPVNFKIGRVPILSICGFITIVLYAIRVIYLLSEPAWRAGLLMPWVSGTLIGVLLTGTITYFGFYMYRKKRGISIELAFKEIPPE